MKKISRVFVCAFILLAVILTFGCETGEIKMISGGGRVTFGDGCLSGVEIYSNYSNLGTTDQEGNFEFNVKAKTLTVFPKLEGYYFIPKSITIDDDNDRIDFQAVKITNLQGTLSLSQIAITPTSIASMGDNYCFMQNGEQCIKLSKLFVKYKNENISVIQNEVYLYKNKQNYIEFNDNISFACGEKTSLGFLLNANFISLGREWTGTNTSYTYLNISSNQTNAELDNNKIRYTLFGINSETKAFTYDITFVFDYVNE